MVSLSMTLSDPTRILTASRGFVSYSWAFLLSLKLLWSSMTAISQLLPGMDDGTQPVDQH